MKLAIEIGSAQPDTLGLTVEVGAACGKAGCGYGFQRRSLVE